MDVSGIPKKGKEKEYWNLSQEYLENHNLNTFTINKAISKCRDSYRVSKEDKEVLLKYKKKEHK